jgi:hypothetical protein
MLSSLILAAAIASSSPANAKPDPCDLGPWPASFSEVASPTFADLQQLYLIEVPELMTSESVVQVGESTARTYERIEWTKRADKVVNAVYRAQLETLMKQCESRWEGEQESPDLEASGIIEDSYARVLAHTNLRNDPEISGQLLPFAFSENLTARIGVVGLSLACSTATPAIASLLAEAKVHCGLIKNQSGH